MPRIRKAAGLEKVVERPHDWDKAVLVAYLRLIGASQKETAQAADVGERTIRTWECSPFWPEAMEEASGERWLKFLIGESRKGLASSVGKDGTLALKVLERIDARLMPLKQQVEIAGQGGGPIEHHIKVTRTILRETDEGE